MQLLPELFADGVLDAHFEGGVFRLTLASIVAMPPQEGSNSGSAEEEGNRVAMAPKATLLLTEPAFAMLCDVLDGMRQEMAKADSIDQPASSPNFGG